MTRILRNRCIKLSGDHFLSECDSRVGVLSAIIDLINPTISRRYEAGRVMSGSQSRVGFCTRFHFELTWSNFVLSYLWSIF
jgi:hypothetical protein